MLVAIIGCPFFGYGLVIPFPKGIDSGLHLLTYIEPGVGSKACTLGMVKLIPRLTDTHKTVLHEVLIEVIVVTGVLTGELLDYRGKGLDGLVQCLGLLIS